MKLVRKADRELHDNESVTGVARLERMLSAQTDDGVRLALVHFEDGARTYWHTHPGEQVLLVTEGECRFGNEAGDEGVAAVGDVIYIPPGERHWHGAVAGQNMAHLSITTVGGPNWMEPVADD